MTAMAQGLVTENTAISADTITARTSRGLFQSGTVKRLRRSDLHSKQWISWVKIRVSSAAVRQASRLPPRAAVAV